MDSKRIRKAILELIALRNLQGTSYEHIVSRVSAELKNQGVSKKSVAKELDAILTSGQLRRVRSDGKKEPVIQFGDSGQKGTLFVLSRSQGGYIVPIGTSKRVPVPYDACRGYKNGDVVSFVSDSRTGNISIARQEKANGQTNTGLVVSTQTVITGYVYKNEYGHYQFYAQDKRKCPDALAVLNNNSKLGNLEGCLVSGIINEVDASGSTITLTKVLGRVGDPLPETNALAMEAGIDLTPNARIEAEVNAIPESVDVRDYNLTDMEGNYLNGKDPNKFDYVDLRNKMFTTIDPFDCRDMDDSVYTEIDADGNYVTYAAIADVTEYVKPGTEIWNAALKQGFTLYTPYKSYPMIPEKLSNGILSLNEGEDRLTLCCKTVIDRNTGKRIPEKTQIVHAVINSKKKFAYQHVQQFADKNNVKAIANKVAVRAKLSGGAEPLSLEEATALNIEVANCVWKNFKSRDVLNINRNDEKQFVLSKDGTKVLGITQKEHLPSMEVIEALMINTNEAVAEFTFSNKLNSVYRVHDQPNLEKVERLRAMMGLLGVEFTGGGDNRSLQMLVDKTNGMEISDTVKEFVLRTQSKAKYSNKPYPIDAFGNDKKDRECHSALKSEYYSHFTSGIRRMSDLLAQYTIKESLRGHKQPFSEEYVAQVASLVTSLELNIEDAEHKINDMYTAIWAEDHMNEVLTGKIANIGLSYVTVENQETGIRVYVPTNEICEGGTSDEFGIGLYNSRGKLVKKLCDTVDVKICGADRVGRMVYASTDLTKTYENPFTPEKSVAKTIEDAQNRGKGLISRWGRQPGFTKVVKATTIPESPRTFRDKGEKTEEKGIELERNL